MQKIYTKKTPFGTFRSDKPLSHGLSVFLIVQSFLYFDLGFLGLCGLLYCATDTNVVVDKIVFWSVAMVLADALAVCGVVVTILRISAFEKFRREVKLFALLEDPANALTAEDGAAICENSLSASVRDVIENPDENASADAVLDAQSRDYAQSRGLVESVGEDKRRTLLSFAIRTLQADLKNATTKTTKESISSDLQKLNAHLLADRPLRRIHGDSTALMTQLDVQATLADEVPGFPGLHAFTVSIPRKTVSLPDGTPAVLDGFFKVSVKRNGETVSELFCMLPLNGTADAAAFTGYCPTPNGEAPLTFTCEAVSLWQCEYPLAIQTEI